MVSFLDRGSPLSSLLLLIPHLFLVIFVRYSTILPIQWIAYISRHPCGGMQEYCLSQVILQQIEDQPYHKTGCRSRPYFSYMPKGC